VLFREASANVKLSPQRIEKYRNPNTGKLFERRVPRRPFVSSTYTSIQATCPKTCPMRSGGCYASAGFMKATIRKLDTDAGTGLAVVRAEAAAIDASFGGERVPQDGAQGGRDLRLHVSGDVPLRGIASAVEALSDAAARWRARGGGAVFTYTHSWRAVHRKTWGPISVLASCDRPEEIAAARKLGYAASLVVGAFPAGAKSWRLPGVPGRIVPCPAQTRDTTCAECRLCLDRDLHKLGVTIAFEAHGTGAARVKRFAWEPQLDLPAMPPRVHLAVLR